MANVSQDRYGVTGAHAGKAEWSGAALDQIHAALEEVLRSAPMRGTQQCQSLLRYVVAHTLNGEDALLRERVIGSQVFGRRPDYEPGEDPVVRIRAADLRKRLALYYQARAEAPAVRIEVPSGSYRAVFVWPEPVRAGEAELRTFSEAEEVPGPAEARAVEVLPTLQPLPEGVADLPSMAGILHPAAEVLNPGAAVLPGELSSAPAKRAVWLGGLPGIVVGMLAGVLLAGLAYAGWSWRQDAPLRTLRVFWGPVLKSPRPALISIGSNAVYRVSDATADAYVRSHASEAQGMEVFPDFPANETIAAAGITPAWNSFVALGDVQSVSEVVATLSQFHKPFQERFPGNTSYAEVQGSPSVLIGGFNNPMTQEMTRHLRYTLSSRNRITDTATGKYWDLHASLDSRDTEDFAIVTRLAAHGDTEPLIGVAGMGQYGTLAATEFIRDPDSLKGLTGQLPRDWQSRNLQVVLRIRVLDFKPVGTSVLATHVW